MAGKIRTLGPGIFKITDTTNGRDFSADLTKAQLNPSNSSDDPTTYLDGSEETNTTTTWTVSYTHLITQRSMVQIHAPLPLDRRSLYWGRRFSISVQPSTALDQS